MFASQAQTKTTMQFTLSALHFWLPERTLGTFSLRTPGLVAQWALSPKSRKQGWSGNFGNCKNTNKISSLLFTLGHWWVCVLTWTPDSESWMISTGSQAGSKRNSFMHGSVCWRSFMPTTALPSLGKIICSDLTGGGQGGVSLRVYMQGKNRGEGFSSQKQ